MNEYALFQLQQEIAELEKQLTDKKRLFAEAQKTFVQQSADTVALCETINQSINNHSPPEAKIALFRSLFKGREDVYAKRFESKKTGKSGYQPVCRNEWERGICEKPKINCGNCTQRAFEPVTGEVIRNHLAGFIPAKNEWAQPAPFVMGVYPLLQNETCNFLALDFDNDSWQEDARAFGETCKLENIPAALERSRSGNGAHI
jgi:hypothetical protein